MSWAIRGQPFQVQQKALEEGDGCAGFAYFMEMGLGKSAVFLAEFIKLYQNQKVSAGVVICPSSLLALGTGWQEQVTEWGIRELFPEIEVVFWPKKPTRKGPFIVFMNYEAFSGGNCPGKSFLESVVQRRSTIIALDESTQIKNHNAVRTKNLLLISKNAKYTRALSGNPIIQGPQDLWAQLRFVRATDLNYYAFRNRYCRMGGWMNKQVIGARNEDELAALLKMCSFQAKKEDWTDLPPKLPAVTRMVKLSKEESNHYAAMKRDFMTYINGETVEASQVITQLLKLQQISSGFINDENGVAQPVAARPAKLDELESVLEETSGKTLIFVYFRYSISLLRQALRDRYQPAIMVNKLDFRAFGTTLEAEKSRFETDPKCRVFIIQTQTGKYGHTLLGGNGDDRCSNTIFYENSFSLDDRKQAEDRNHRHGQDKPVSYTDLVCSDVEQTAIRALQRKESIANSILNRYRQVSHGNIQSVGSEVS